MFVARPWHKMGARVTCGWLLCCVLVNAAIVSAIAEDTGAACTKGDTPCFCKAIGGTWKALQSPLLPACKVTYQHQGMCMIVFKSREEVCSQLGRSSAVALNCLSLHSSRGGVHCKLGGPECFVDYNKAYLCLLVFCCIRSRCIGLYRQVHDNICCRPVIQPICAANTSYVKAL